MSLSPMPRHRSGGRMIAVAHASTRAASTFASMGLPARLRMAVQGSVTTPWRKPGDCQEPR
jgi:hypothetical protein